MEDSFVVLWKHLEELACSFRPVVEDALTALRSSQSDVFLKLCFDKIHLFVATLDELIDVDHVGVQVVLNKVTRFIVDVSHAARHTSAEVTASRAKIDHHATSHVFERVVAESFDNCFDAGITNAETFASHACDVGFTRSRSVEANVASDDVFVSYEWRGFVWANNNLAARESFAEIVISIADHGESHALRAERTERLTSRTSEVHLDRVFREASRIILAGNFRASDRSNHTVGIDDW